MPYCDVGTLPSSPVADSQLNNDIKIFYRTYGGGPTKVLLIIGSSSSLRFDFFFYFNCFVNLFWFYGDWTNCQGWLRRTTRGAHRSKPWQEPPSRTTTTTSFGTEKKAMAASMYARLTIAGWVAARCLSKNLNTRELLYWSYSAVCDILLLLSEILIRLLSASFINSWCGGCWVQNQDHGEGCNCFVRSSGLEKSPYFWALHGCVPSLFFLYLTS